MEAHRSIGRGLGCGGRLALLRQNGAPWKDHPVL
jgi:hypothetical protein